MWAENKIFKEDLDYITSAGFIDWQKLDNKAVFVTGATGLIGYTFVSALLYRNLTCNSNIKIIALVRNITKAKEKFASQLKHNLNLKFVVGDVENLPPIDEEIDFIIHGANPTASSYFVENPVETIKTAVWGTNNILNLAKEKNISGLVCLSSMEVYGYPKKGHKVKEEEIGALTPLDIRNSYPIAKMASESMTCAYASEYGVPTMICRLTQTFGPCVNYNDNRIFAYFGRCVNEKKNIVLKTNGKTERCYLYTTDAVTAILTIMLNGVPGHAYNAADEDTYCSIAEMAERVAADAGIDVEYDIQDEVINGFPQTLYMNLDTTALKELGWMPCACVCGGGGETIAEMFRRMAVTMILN